MSSTATVGVGALTMSWRAVIAAGIPAPSATSPPCTQYGTGAPAAGANSHPNTLR